MNEGNKRNKRKRKLLHSGNFYPGVDSAIVKIVCRTAADAIGKNGLRDQDLPDVEQEIMLAVYDGLPKHDIERSHSLRFIKLLAETAVKRIMRRRRGYSGRVLRTMVSLNQMIDLDGDFFELQELVNDEGQFQQANSRSALTRYDEMLERLDAVGSLEECPEQLKRVVRALESCNVIQVAADLDIPSYTVYRMLQRCRDKIKNREIFNFCGKNLQNF